MIPDFLSRRPSVTNVLHALRLARPQTSTTVREIQGLRDYARGRSAAIEIGTHMGVTAAAIAESLSADGKLYCVDPWPRGRAGENPSFQICLRELKRRGLADRVQFFRGASAEVAHLLPRADFMFIDGDHSRKGIALDWNIVRQRLDVGGFACFHDTSVPSGTAGTVLDSVGYFDDVIRHDGDFEHVDSFDSMNVLCRRTIT